MKYTLQLELEEPGKKIDLTMPTSYTGFNNLWKYFSSCKIVLYASLKIILYYVIWRKMKLAFGTEYQSEQKI